MDGVSNTVNPLDVVPLAVHPSSSRRSSEAPQEARIAPPVQVPSSRDRVATPARIAPAMAAGTRQGATNGAHAGLQQRHQTEQPRTEAAAAGARRRWEFLLLLSRQASTATRASGPGRGRRPPTSSGTASHLISRSVTVRFLVRGMLLLTRLHLAGALLDDESSDGRRLPRSPPIYGRRACLTLTTVDQEEAAKQASLDRDCFQALKLLPMLC